MTINSSSLQIDRGLTHLTAAGECLQFVERAFDH